MGIRWTEDRSIEVRLRTEESKGERNGVHRPTERARGRRTQRAVATRGQRWYLECSTGDFLVGPIPYAVILGIDWLVNHKVAWYFQSDKLRTYVNGRWCDRPVLCREGDSSQGTQAYAEPVKTAADHAYDDLARQVDRMSAEEAAALLRPPTKRYKSRHRARGRVRIKDILREAREDTAALKRALEGLHCVVFLSAAEPDRVVHVPIERQGPLLCAIVKHLKVIHVEPGAPPIKPIDTAPPPSVDIDDSPWPTAKLQYTVRRLFVCLHRFLPFCVNIDSCFPIVCLTDCHPRDLTIIESSFYPAGYRRARPYTRCHLNSWLITPRR
ncbi:uncharacterized protein EMH_0015060 [Eimeria mitis]|uniref:Uncharacterized protein n=1 Tax=Eimeria mitis TaxID=44415 RepID=U6KCH8_9EIME|nr:uncharacterized protein EMH_0015060 [Eimeria mitis]CDJ33193.1 hypothetical protein EMH_0015060 [Eimeria mitis]